jgi:chromosome segregation ATPase
MTQRIWRNGAAWAGSALMALAFAAIPATARARQQSDPQESTGDAVADAARKAREKKKDATKPAKVYTDEDVRHAVPSDTPTDAKPAGTDQGADKNTDAQGAQGKDAKGKPSESEESRWRKQFQDAHTDLARMEKELDILQREGNKAQLQYYSDPQKAMKEQYTRQEINENDTKIAAKKKEIEQQKQKISDMEDALRKAGGDPGWANP